MVPRCVLLPPSDIRGRQSDWSSYVLRRVASCKTLKSTWPVDRQKALTHGTFKRGQRLELLDRLESTRVRPARVLQQVGQRIYLAISPEDAGTISGQEDIQLEGVWLHECSGLLFPVGWAVHNGYGLQAATSYLQHCQEIEEALMNDQPPPYDPSIDSTPEMFTHHHTTGTAESWAVGMKFECLDPLNSSFLELRAAACLGILKDGYLRIGFDDAGSVEEESIPVHCTSPLLFPVGYAEEHGIVLKGPIVDGAEFSWANYLPQQEEATPAPSALFHPVPSLSQFKIGSKLEATDQCEPNLVCPATLVDIKGRLLRIHFDGWEEEMDQLFDYRSFDLFPIGWCDMNGFLLESPKAPDEAPPKKKKQKKALKSAKKSTKNSKGN